MKEKSCICSKQHYNNLDCSYKKRVKVCWPRLLHETSCEYAIQHTPFISIASLHRQVYMEEYSENITKGDAM